MNGRTLRSVWATLAAAGLALVASACSDTTVNKTEATVEWTIKNVLLPEGTTSTTIDFGTIALDTESIVEVKAKNTGNATLTIKPFVLESPFRTDIPTTGILDLEPGATGVFHIFFRPTEEQVYDPIVSVETTSETEGGTLQATLSGTGVKPRIVCSGPDLENPNTLNFGKVVYGNPKTMDVNCTNETPVDAWLRVGEIGDDGHQFFDHNFHGSAARQLVKANETKPLPIRFSPNKLGDVFASLPLTYDNGSSIALIRLSAFVIEYAFEVSPKFVNFGYVAPGQCSAEAKRIELRNLGADPLSLASVAYVDPSDHRYDGWKIFDPEGNELTTFPMVIGPAVDEDTPGKLFVDFVFCPIASDLGVRSAMIKFVADDRNNPEVVVQLDGFAGGPVLHCSPESLDFGLVAKGIGGKRSFSCVNAGTDRGGVDDDRLKIESLTTSNPEFIATTKDPINPAGYGVGETFVVNVEYQPQNDGIDNALVKIKSNSTIRGDTYDVNATGHGRDLPPCQFHVSPVAGLKFGIVENGKQATLEFAVINDSYDSECFIQDLHLSENAGGAFFLPQGDITFVELPASTPEMPGQIRVPVTFAPVADGIYDGVVAFTITNPTTPNIFVPVHGSSQKACAMIAPDDLDFGTVKPGCFTRDRELTIINVCPAPLVIDRVEVNASVEEEFFIREGVPNGTSIPTGLDKIFTMAYKPFTEGDDIGSVFVYVVGQAEPYMATLHGRARNNALQTDTFNQNDRPKVDLLWVLDNSGSMSEEQNNIAANMRPFLSFAQAQQIDYRIAVTTTGLTGGSGCPGGADGNENGRFFPVDNSRPRILTPQTANLEATWIANVQVGICHYDEQPFEAAYRALSPPLINNYDDPRTPMPNDGNEGFLRKEAHLSIIAMTDEVDQSPQTVNFYYNFYQSLKGFRNTHLFNFHAITGPRGGCSSSAGNAENGDRLISMVEKTDGGQFQSICQTDWSKALQQMSVSAFGFKTCFFLGNQPEDTDGNGIILDGEEGVGGEVEVRLNDNVVPSVNDVTGSRHWMYSKDQNAICFFPYATPEPGTEIQIDYHVACL